MLEDESLARQARIEADSAGSSSAINYVHIMARRVIVWAAIVATAGFAGVGLSLISYILIRNNTWFNKIMQQHFAAVVGMPGIAALAFLIVITFEARFDAIEMEFFGIMRFKGASGPIVLWVLCVITMACCVRMLW